MSDNDTKNLQSLLKLDYLIPPRNANISSSRSRSASSPDCRLARVESFGAVTRTAATDVAQTRGAALGYELVPVLKERNQKFCFVFLSFFFSKLYQRRRFFRSLCIRIL